MAIDAVPADQEGNPMTTRILHHPRVAWDLARAVVAGAGSTDELYAWLNLRVAQLLGDSYARDLYDTRVRLVRAERPDVRQVEAGRWRARIEDVLGFHPDLAEDLSLLHLDTSFRLRE
jgi:hypothetical protein